MGPDGCVRAAEVIPSPPGGGVGGAAVRVYEFPRAPTTPAPVPVDIPEPIQAPVAPARITARRRPVTPRGVVGSLTNLPNDWILNK